MLSVGGWGFNCDQNSAAQSIQVCRLQFIQGKTLQRTQFYVTVRPNRPCSPLEVLYPKCGLSSLHPDRIPKGVMDVMIDCQS